MDESDMLIEMFQTAEERGHYWEFSAFCDHEAGSCGLDFTGKIESDFVWIDDRHE